MVPDSIPTSLWEEFKKHRKKLKAPMTEHAESLILAKLEKWKLENGANPIDVINESIEKGWRGVFLNGHAKVREDKDRGISVALAPVCCSCGGNLDSGYYYSSKGRKCHNC